MRYEPLKSGPLEDENIHMVNWKKYSNCDGSIFEYAIPVNFGTWITKGIIYVIYLKNKESFNLEQLRKT